MTDPLPRISFATRLRNYFLTGLIISAPIAITIWLTWTFIHWADSWVKPYIPIRYNPESYLQFAIPGFGLLIAVIIMTLIGFFGTNLMGRSIVNASVSILDRTPLVRSVYRSLRQIFETVLKDQSTSFKKVGLIEYPSPGLWSLVFISGEVKGELATRFSAMGHDMMTVFLPPTPVPTAGFMIFVPRDKILILDMSPDDAAKLLISVGIVTPEHKEQLVVSHGTV